MPDFWTVDSFGRQADEFQFYIAYDYNEPNPGQTPVVDRLIRGGEIYLGNGIPIREGDKDGESLDPTSGGWGNVVGFVPFSLTSESDGSALLLFDVPYDLIGDTDHRFALALLTAEYGAATREAQSTFPGPDLGAVPEPKSGLLLLTLAAILIIRWRPGFQASRGLNRD